MFIILASAGPFQYYLSRSGVMCHHIDSKVDKEITLASASPCQYYLSTSGAMCHHMFIPKLIRKAIPLLNSLLSDNSVTASTTPSISSAIDKFL